jgi:hypothetical protein
MRMAQTRRQEETVNQIVGRKPSGNERQARLVPTCMQAPTWALVHIRDEAQDDPSPEPLCDNV